MIQKTKFKDLFLIKSTTHKDQRGYFKELIRENITGRLDISSLESGTYILNLTDGINTSTHKIIKD